MSIEGDSGKIETPILERPKSLIRRKKKLGQCNR